MCLPMSVRVLHVITGLGTGGAERNLYNLLAAGVSAPDEVAVIALMDEGSYGPRIRELGIEVHALGMRQGIPAPWTLPRLGALVRRFAPDVIQGWMYHGNLMASMAARLCRQRPAVSWNVRQCLYQIERHKPLTRWAIRANRRLSGGPGAIVFNSRLSRRQHRDFGFRDDAALVIPNGFDTAAVAPDSASRQHVRKRLGFNDEQWVVGHVARCHPIKDHPNLLRACVTVAERMPLARFLVVGRGVDFDAPELAGIVPDEYRSRFLLTGERDDVGELMQAMDVFCQSSWLEAFPNALAEAMACELSCVATDVGDSDYILGTSGRIVPPRDSQALARALLEALNEPADRRRERGREARERIVSEFGLAQVVEQYRQLYQRIGLPAQVGSLPSAPSSEASSEPVSETVSEPASGPSTRP
ncbi:hypothetical protein C6W88_13640 [Halomonas litopenaei]|uniref:Glycosyltransferase subfamily 4-like N-terminal domain-containing protein n=2 Tax=Halomonadaceae TaxID=28256 RepID=A0ABX5ITX4_9GAMM|nr:hypothetical protein C6W89_10975 [Halomonas sp. SYSU XM8]PTL93987.1 hypothetical protein C6W88_13640 [Halomonas litopenaei]